MAKQQSVVIIGGGIMGGDIAIIFAAGNWNVHVMSPSEKTRSSLPARVKTGLEKLDAPDGAAALVKAYATLEEIPWQEIDLVVEAATEDLALKQKLFSQLETLARPDIPLASNTSTFPTRDIDRGAPQERGVIAYGRRGHAQRLQLFENQFIDEVLDRRSAFDRHS